METSRLKAPMGFQCQVPCSVRWRQAPCDSFLILSPTYPCPTLAPTHQRRDLPEWRKDYWNPHLQTAGEKVWTQLRQSS